MHVVCTNWSAGFPRDHISKHTEVNVIDTEQTQTLVAGLLGEFERAIDFRKALATLDEAKLGSQEDVVSFASTLEPFAHELFAIAVQTVPISVQRAVCMSIGALTRSCPNACIPAHEHDRALQNALRHWE